MIIGFQPSKVQDFATIHNKKKQRRTPRFGRGGDGGAASLALKYPEVEVLQVGLGVGVEWIPSGKHTKSYGKWPFIVGFTHL